MPAVAFPSPQRRGAAQEGAAQAAPTEPCRPSGPRLANSRSLIAGFDCRAVHGPSGPEIGRLFPCQNNREEHRNNHFPVERVVNPLIIVQGYDIALSSGKYGNRRRRHGSEEDRF